MSILRADNLKAILTKGRLGALVWYYSLSKVPSGGITIALEINDNGESKRRYTTFPTPNKLYNFINSCAKVYRNFYEVIDGTKISKMRYDLDYHAASTEDYNAKLSYIPQTVLAAIRQQTDTEMLVYSSCKYPKISYHIVLPQITGTHKQLRQYYNETLALLTAEDRPFVDVAVYKKSQNFRLLHCSKANADRYKIPAVLDNYVHPERDEYTAFEDSLLSSLNRPHTPLTYEIVDYVPPSFELGVNEQELMTAIAELGEFNITETKGNLVILKRLAPSYCSACERSHEAENPFVIVYPNGDVRFNCRRNSEGKTTLISAGIAVVDNTDITEEVNKINSEFVKFAVDYRKLVNKLFV